ncbi:MAG: von Willebrand factor type A domain-containing protein, partial [Rickettsiales bacterium]
MTDNWDEIENLLKNSKPPTPSEVAKNLAISKAMAEFEKKHSKSRQGISPVTRLMDAVQAAFINTIGEFNMRKAYILAGGVCVSLLAVTLMNTTNLSTDLLPKPASEESYKGDVSKDTIFTKEKYAGEKVIADKKSVWTAESSAVQSPSAPVAMLQPPPPAEAMAYEPAPKQEMAKNKVFFYPAENGADAMSPGVATGSADMPVSNMIAPYPDYDWRQNYYQNEGRDKFQDSKENPTKLVKEEPISTFSVDVDTSSYSFMRASLNNNVLPQKDAVRIEEMVNYFPYDYEVPKDKSEPFKANVSVFPTPWNPDTKLMHIGIKGYQIEQKEKPHSNLVFLIDTSGSMNDPNKLPLLKNSFKLLLDSLKADDTVAIVTYAGSAGVALEPTKISDKSKIINVLDNLGAGGSTAG